MLCRLCRKHNVESKRMVWLMIPCNLLRKDKLRDHEWLRCHADTVQAEAIASAAKRSGGIYCCLLIRAGVFTETSSTRRSI